MRSFKPVTDNIVEELKHLIGAGNVIFGDHEAIESYAHDETVGMKSTSPEVVVRPTGTRQVADIMKLANREKIPVTPRGAGSGLSGGAVAAFGGILMSLDRMNRVIDLDTDNMTVTCEPGIVTNELNDLVQEKGLFYAGYPMSLETCYIGGNVAENAGGGRAIKYGVTNRYVLGLEVVLPTGEIVEMGGKRVKDVTGYNLVQLMVGSEGTLGIVTRVILKLLPLPAFSAVLLAPFAEVSRAIEAVPAIIAGSRVIPSAIEFMDHTAVNLSCDNLNDKLPFRDAPAMLLIELDGAAREQVEKEYEQVGELCFKLGAKEVFVADNHTTRHRVWKIRSNIPEALKLAGENQSSEDLVVPPAAIVTLVEGVKEMAEAAGLTCYCFGHAGDGNMHIHIVGADELSPQAWAELRDPVRKKMYQLTRDLGGTLTGEHGIGAKHRNRLAEFLSPELIALMARIQHAFDPNGIMNPGKIFPDKT